MNGSVGNNMKNDTFLVTFCAVSNMDVSDQTLKEEFNLEDLITCVSIGKTAIDQVSGKCRFSMDDNSTEVNNDDFSKPSESNFNPLKFPVSTSDVTESSEQLCKRFKKCSDAEKSDLNFSELDEKNNRIVCKIQAVEKSCPTQRLKRKRHLFDLESHGLNKINDMNNISNVSRDNCSLECFKNRDESKVSVVESKEVFDGCTDETSVSCPNNSFITSETETDADCLILTRCDEDKIKENVRESLPDITHLTLTETTDVVEKPLSGEFLPEIYNVSAETESSINNLCDESSNSEINCSDVAFACNDQTESILAKTKKRKSDSSSTETESRSLRKRIRKTLPPVKARQTPMGLPKPLRIKKKSFSLEEVYTNKNYSTPIPKQLETIFEYPKEDKDGTVKYVEKRRKHRAMYFCTDPADRPIKKKNKYKKRSTRRNKKETEAETDAKLIQVLSDLDQHFLINNLSP